MAQEDIEGLLHELENLVNEAKSPISGVGTKKIVDQNAVYDLIDDMKSLLPKQLKEAKIILQNEQKILRQAEEQRDLIIRDANARAEVLAGNEEVVRIANNKAAEIHRQAELYADSTMTWALETAATTFESLNNLLDHFEVSINSLREQVNVCYETVRANADSFKDELEQASDEHDR